MPATRSSGRSTGATRLASRTRNPELGLASSLHVGLEAVAGLSDPDVSAALIVLGDQPRLRPDVIEALVDAWREGSRPIVAPRYAESGTLNPVLLAREAWPTAIATTGDRGMGPLIHASPDLVTFVPVAGDNPDVDTRADLERLALEAAWADRVRGNREQVDRFREVPDGADFYRPTSQLWVVDPLRSGDEVLDALVGLSRPDDVWLDIGAGAGRYALPLARHVREVIALDPSAGMLRGLREGMASHGIANIRVIEGRWPAAADDLRADVALLAHVGYDIDEIGPFVDAMERAAGRLCVAVLMERAPAFVAAPFWPPVHGEERVALPALGEFVALLEARGRQPEVRRLDAEARRWVSPEDALAFLRQQTWVAPDSEKGRRLNALVEAIPRAPDGSIEIAATHREIGIVTWSP